MAPAHRVGMSSNKSEVAGIETKIYLIRGEKVMLDHDLAGLYQVPNKRLKEQVRRNLKRFPDDFMFILTDHELKNLRSQIATSSSGWGGRRTPPFAFTEQGVAMLSTVLNSEIAIGVNISIIRTFVKLRKVLSSNSDLGNKIADLESKYDKRFKVVFDAIRGLMAVRSIPRKRIIGLSKSD